MKRALLLAAWAAATCTPTSRTVDEWSSRYELDKKCRGAQADPTVCGALAIQVASALSVGINLRTPAGTTARFGSLEQQDAMPGAIQADLELRTEDPLIKVTSLRLNGLHPSTLAALARIRRPIAQTPLDRVIRITFIDGDAHGLIGRIDVGPSGAIALDSILWQPLVQFADRHDRLASTWTLRTAMRGELPARAERGARLIVEQLDRTTADLVR